MLSRQFIREQPDEVREAARKKHVDLPLDRLLELDARVEDLKRELQARREESNRVSRSIAKAAHEDRAALVERGRVLREEIRVLEEDMRVLEAELHALLLRVPNIPDPSVPEGADESANAPVRYWGEPPRFDFSPRDHVALMERLGMLDIERGAKVAGSRSYILRGAGALLEMALTQLAMDRLVAGGFTPLIVPALVREFCLVGSGWFPGGREQTYELP